MTPKASFVILSLWSAALLATPSPCAAQGGQQLPTPTQAIQMLQQNPQLAEQLRQRLAQSGLSADQIRARLRAAGYPDTLLNAYIGPEQKGGMTSPDAVAAITALGLPPVALEGQDIPVDTGMMGARAGMDPESLTVGNYVFGIDVFRRGRTQFLPLLAGPVPPDYRLGAGDELVLILSGEVELAQTLPVTREGFVIIPLVGQVFVNNLTLHQLEEILYGRLGKVYSGVRRSPNASTQFHVTVASVRANQVYIIGEVEQPGAYQISALGTVLTGLYAAGGMTSRGSVRHIEVRRQGTVIDTLDLYDYLLRGDTRSDIRLEAGDVVFVPMHGVRAQATGAVVRPAYYELKKQETLLDLLRAAGGFRPNAAIERVTVHRLLSPAERSRATPSRMVIDVPIGSAHHEGSSPGSGVQTSFGGMVVPPVPLENGDVLVVDDVPPFYREYYVGVAGMVLKPGVYPWHPGMTLRDVVLLARGPLVGADLREAEIARMPTDRSQGQLATTIRVAMDSTYLYNRDSSGRYYGPPGPAFASAGAPEVPLLPYDNVLILKQPEFDMQRAVVIVGQVRYPGAYSLRTKTDRLADIVARAGGLTPQAYGEGIRFVRRLGEVGRINVDLVGALKDGASRNNIVLQPDDSIEIPEYQPSVKVSGAVNSPGSVLWKKGQGLEFYLGAAGGFSYKADKGRVSVRYANGEVRSRSRSLFVTFDPKPGPGSEVFVPDKDLSHITNWIGIATAVTGLLSTTLAIVVLVGQL